MKANVMQQWADHTLRAKLSCGCCKLDDGTLRIGTIAWCSSDHGSARVVTEAPEIR